jgi:hypothetical protein
MSSKYFIKNITPLNVLLTSVIVFMAYYTLFPLIGADIKYALPSPGKTVLEKTGPPEGLNPAPLSSYTIIADNNLFHPERKIPVEKKTAEEQQPLPKPDVVLYGTLITDSLSLAYLEDLKAPRNTPGRGRRQTAMKIGDTLSGFVLKEIDTDKIVMAKGDENMTVYVHDPTKLKRRDTAATQPPHTPVKAAAIGQAARPSPRTPPSVESLVKPAPTPKTRARMTKTDEKVLDVFRRLPP